MQIEFQQSIMSFDPSKMVKGTIEQLFSYGQCMYVCMYVGMYVYMYVCNACKTVVLSG